MDITHNLKKKKRKSDYTSRKQSRASTKRSMAGRVYYANGERIVMEKDLVDLPEIDENDPEVQKWYADFYARFRMKFPKLTSEEADKIIDTRFAELENKKKSRAKKSAR